WRQIGNNWYYLMPGGKMAVGWCVVDSNWYYFDTNGVWAN
ncbi:MAG: N-acetylmuramoyl-L-alanine amidase family protein, partial [Lachnospiraceae bacterium]